MEKAYSGMNAELTNEITLIEAGATRFYAPDKGSFQGRDATELVRQQGRSTKLVYGAVAATDCDLYGGEPVMQADRVVGVCTSGGYGHACGQSLGFAYIDPQVDASGLEVVILGERKPFTLLDAPTWDPSNARQKV
jgi:dimethylglycine dehydrogenase